MNQLSLTFIAAIALIWVIFLIIPKRYRAPYLLAVSLLIYFWIEPHFFFLLLIEILLTFAAARIMSAQQSQKRKFTLLLYLFATSLLYFPFKYFHLSPLLPLGLSFYTFQALSYIFDVYYLKIPASKNLLQVALYLSFFPQLTSGPIERFSQSGMALTNPERLIAKKNISLALFFFISGAFKKILADGLMPFSTVYSPTVLAATGGGAEWFAYAILTRYHLFLDFSGYTDLALACAQLFGISLTNNFQRPFAAKTIEEFWRKWHVSLSSWMRDYVFYPLVASIRSPYALQIALVGSFVFLGLWHGGSWNFFIYGLINGLAIVGTLTLKKHLKRILSPRTLKKSEWLLWPLHFLFFISLPTIFLRTQDWSHSQEILTLIFTRPERFWYYSKTARFIWEQLRFFLPLIVLYEVCAWADEKFSWREKMTEMHFYFQLFLMQLACILLFFFARQIPQEAPFFYQNF